MYVLEQRRVETLGLRQWRPETTPPMPCMVLALQAQERRVGWGVKEMGGAFGMPATLGVLFALSLTQ